MKADGFQIRKTILGIIEAMNPRDRHEFNAYIILREAEKRLNFSGLESQQALLTVWDDLFRLGIIGWGHDLNNLAVPHFHLTDTGRKTLQNLSHDPYNPDGYLAKVKLLLANRPVALSYIEEAVQTFNSGCYKATAVMVGAAAESIVLDIRDTLVKRMDTQDINSNLLTTPKKISQIRNAITNQLKPKIPKMELALSERYSGFWVAFTDHIRIARNDAGHPASIQPVEHDTVHGILLIFPAFAEMARDLEAWISKSF